MACPARGCTGSCREGFPKRQRFLKFSDQEAQKRKEEGRLGEGTPRRFTRVKTRVSGRDGAPGRGVVRALLTRGRAAVLWPRLQAAKTKTPCCRARLGDGHAWRSRRGTLGPGAGFRLCRQHLRARGPGTEPPGRLFPSVRTELMASALRRGASRLRCERGPHSPLETSERSH